MPIVVSKEISTSTSLYVWKTTESLKALLALANFTEAEQIQFLKFKSEQRRREWAAVRALLNTIYNKKVQVRYTALGKPEIDCAPYVSLSHTQGFVLVMIGNEAQVGADCEFISDRILRIKERFLNQNEMLSLENGTELRQVLVYWCLKEVLFKIAPVGEIDFREDMEISAFEPKTSNTLSGSVRHGNEQTKAELGYEFFEDVLISWGVKSN